MQAQEKPVPPASILIKPRQLNLHIIITDITIIDPIIIIDTITGVITIVTTIAIIADGN